MTSKVLKHFTVDQLIIDIETSKVELDKIDLDYIAGRSLPCIMQQLPIAQLLLLQTSLIYTPPCPTLPNPNTR